MRLLRRRGAGDSETIAAAVRRSLSALEPGLTLLCAPATAGDVAVDLVAVDARGRLILVVCEPVATPATITRALEAAQWWQEHRDLARRVFAEPTLDPALPPRAIVVAERFSERAQRIVRALGVMAPTALTCGLFEDAEAASAPTGAVGSAPTGAVGSAPTGAICLEWLGGPPPGARRAAPEERGAAAPEATREPPHATAGSPSADSPPPASDEVERASALLEHLQRLRFGEAFR